MAKNLVTTSARSAAIGFVATLALFSGIQLNAQAFSGHDSNAPVQIDAGDIDVDDRMNRVVIVGGVVARQAGLTVRSQRMLLNYEDEDSLSISRITATGGVNVQRGNERASGDIAVYDLQRRIITMAGNVTLSRGGDNLRGGRLTIDLNSGRASVDGQTATNGESSSGRVTGTFTVAGSDEN